MTRYFLEGTYWKGEKPEGHLFIIKKTYEAQDEIAAKRTLLELLWSRGHNAHVIDCVHTVTPTA